MKTFYSDNKFRFGAMILAAICFSAAAAMIWRPISLAQQNAQSAREADESRDQTIWREVEQAAIKRAPSNLPADFRAFRLDQKALARLLDKAPHESTTPLGKSEIVLPLPLPNGELSRFRVQEAPVLEFALAERFPELKSYRVLGIDDATITGRFDLTPEGFHATLLAPAKTIVILPADKDDAAVYAAYEGGREPLDGATGCSTGKEQEIAAGNGVNSVFAPQIAVGSTLRTYRIAFSTTYEYSTDVGGGTVAGTVSSINTWLNGLNAIYERELSIRVIMINNTNAIYTTVGDPYNDAAGSSNERTMLDQVRNVLRDQIGEANYNLGHLLTKNSNGGVAYLNAVCSNSTQGGFGALKGGGVSPLSAPVGSANGLKLFAHEVGHQFGAAHTFNGSLGSCGGGNRSANGTSSFEPGSGNTIMSYFGICANDNVAGASDLRFHAHSYAQITDHTINGAGATCAAPVSTGNAAPIVSANGNYTIPKLTPFTLTATASDADAGDQNNLTYAWEQFDAGGTAYAQNGTSATYNDANDPSTTTRPIFRALSPSSSSSRTFPSLEYILNNQNDAPDVVNGLQTAEELPRIGRALNFRVTARDNSGGVDNASSVITVDNNSGPFTIVDPVAAWTGGSTQNVVWNVNNTNTLAANVRILLSVDGGQSFPTILAASAVNNGSASVTVPNGISTSAARIKVEAVGNIFFDISGVNFTIAPGDSCPVVSDINPRVANPGAQVVLTGTNFTNATAVAFGGGANATAFTVNSDTQITATVPAGAQGGAVSVSKSGCAASQSPKLAICPGSLASLRIDDGTIESATSVGNVTSYFVNRLTPASYPATLSSVTIVYPGSFAGFPASVPVTILSGSTTSGGANNTRFQTTAGTANAGATITYSVEPITITAGDFVVGYSINNSGFFPIAVDTSSQQGRSYRSIDGATFDAQTNGNYLIRAGVYSGSCSGTCSYTVSASRRVFSRNGGTGTITIVADAGCQWLAARNNNWITLTGAASGTGSGTLTFSIAANYADARSGSITIGAPTNRLLAGQDVAISQVDVTAAAISVSGRVLTPDGKALRGARVTLTDSQGNVRTASASAFGYYRFANVSAGETIVVAAQSKNFSFAPRVLTATAEVENFDLTASN